MALIEWSFDRGIKIVSALVMAVVGLSAVPTLAEQRPLTDNWQFARGEQPGAHAASYDATGWQDVAVPHDWSIMDHADGRPPFDANAESGQDSGYLPGGIGWYRRDLVLTESEATQIVRLRFEAVYMDSTVWLNGEQVAQHRYGYTAFTVDLTGKVKAGRNVIAVRANHADPSSRWYAGSGIIRPVSLESLNCVHIDPDSVFVTTPVADAEAGVVKVEAQLKNCGPKAQTVEVVTRIVSASGRTVAQHEKTVSATANTPLSLRFGVPKPALWSPASPNLYTLVQEVRIDGRVVDERRVRFGIRTFTMDAENGLRINGEPILLRGGNIHHDNYMLGAAGFDDAERRKVALLKSAGYNAIRSAHNPASKATLEAADELGMIVINEAFDAWNRSKRPQDYARFFATEWQTDIDSMVLSSRNHPSILMWSIGNEIPEQGTPEGVATGKRLADRVRMLDPTRPVTQAVNSEPPSSDAQFAVVDIAGYNYKPELIVTDHKAHPDRVMYTSESTSKDAFKYWQPVEAHPWVIGDFLWTAMDYLGEAAIGWMGYSQDWQKLGPYPWHLAYSGEIDATGRKRPAAYYRQVMWKTGIDPIAAFVRQPEGTEDLPDRYYYEITPPHLDWSLDDVHPSWTWPGQEGKPQEVVVYSEFPEVELFLNGQSLGRKATGKDTEYKATYSVTYAPGHLEAVGYKNGQIAGRWSLHTAGAPSAARITVDRERLRANGQDLAYVTIELTDAKGVPIYARADERRVKVRVLGAGTLAGMGNGDPQDASSLQNGDRKTFHGRVVAVVRAAQTPGEIVIEVEIDGQAIQRVRLNAVS